MAFGQQEGVQGHRIRSNLARRSSEKLRADRLLEPVQSAVRFSNLAGRSARNCAVLSGRKLQIRSSRPLSRSCTSTCSTTAAGRVREGQRGHK